MKVKNLSLSKIQSIWVGSLRYQVAPNTTISIPDRPYTNRKEVSDQLDALPELELVQDLDTEADAIQDAIDAIATGSKPTIVVNADYVADYDDFNIFVNTTSGPITITLPPCLGHLGAEFFVVNLGNPALEDSNQTPINPVIVQGTGADKIYWSAQNSLVSKGQSRGYLSNGANNYNIK